MRIVISLCLLILQGAHVHAAPCASLQTVEECATQTDECTWCDSEACRDLGDCPGAGNGGQGNGGGENGNSACNPLSVDECTGDCHLCADEQVCRATEGDCPGNGGNNGGGGQGNGNGGGGSDNANGSGNEGGSGENSGGGTCNPMKNATDCEENPGGCVWCSEKEVCRASADSCPGGGGATGGQGNGEGNGSANGQGNGGGDSGNANANGQGNGNGNGGAKGPNVCNKNQSEDECPEADCFWCSDKAKCRNSEAECPGQGRTNTCKDLTGDDCESNGCLWCPDVEVCTASRGGKCPQSGGNGGGNGNGSSNGNANGNANGQGNGKLGLGLGALCNQLVGDTNCTANTECRWCPSNSKCKILDAACDDGSLGVRGNPCKDAANETTCFDTPGCLWCTDNSKCKKDIATCGEDDDDEDSIEDGGSQTSIDDGNQTSIDDGGVKGNPCKFLPQPECDAGELTGVCQWCSDQGKCKKSDGLCESQSDEVEIELDYEGARINVQDDGLGVADPNAVFIGLNYLFEVAADGVTQLNSSLIDFEYQDFEIKQVVGTFFDNIQARKISFEATITNVGSIEMDIFVMLSNGTITNGEESWAVEAGDVKFNLIIDDWLFCGESNPCGDESEVGHYLDIAIEVQGNSTSPEASEDDGLVFNLGGGVPLVLSKRVEVDNFMVDMPKGYPRAESSDQGTVFFFRFPKFEERVQYDPIVEYTQRVFLLPVEPPLVTNSPTKAPTKAPTGTPTANPTPKKEDDGLSVGAIVGIVIGILVACCCCVAVGMKSKGDNREDVPEKEAKQSTFMDEEENLESGGSEESEDSDDGDSDDYGDDDEEDSDDDSDDSGNII